MSDWAMPWLLWKKNQKEKNEIKQRQMKLDGAIEKMSKLKEFMREGVLDAVARHIVCNNQALAVAEERTFRNGLVAMRPRSTMADIPSTHDVTQYIHNKFVSLLGTFRAKILVCCKQRPNLRTHPIPPVCC
jgi:hypothetical protein